MASKASLVLQGAVAAAAKAASSADDRELLRRFADGDQAAFALLVARHTGMVFGVCRRAVRSAEDAEDACQATFLVLAKKAKSGRWGTSVASWLYGTARRVARNARVVAERRAKHEAKAARDAVEAVDTMTGRELLAALDEELDRLSATYREPLVLCYLEGLSREEAASRLGVPAGTVKIRLERGRKKLADALTKRGVVGGIGLLALAVTSPAGASPLRTVEAVLHAAAGTVPPRVAALVEGLSMAKVKTAVATIFAATLGVVAVVAAGPLTATGDVPPPAAKSAPPAPPAEEFVFTGRVLDPAGKPLANAKVLVNGMRDGINQFTPMTTSGPDGTFRFAVPVKDIPAKRHGSISVGAFADGYGSMSVFANKPELRANLTVWLPAEEVATGRVIDPEGEPVAGVTLVASVRAAKYRKTGQPLAYDAPEEEGELPTQFVPDDPGREQATTDASGRFTIRGLSRDWLYDLDVWGPTIVTTKAQIVARRAAASQAGELSHPGRPDIKIVRYGSTFDFVAAPCKPISGVVREKGTGKPVAGAELRTVGNYLFPTCHTTADANGRYTLTGLASGVHTLIVDPPAKTPYIRGETKVDARTPGIGVATHDIELARLPVAQGRVTDAGTGKPVAGWVEYRPLATNANLEANPIFAQPVNAFRGPTAALDANGRYSIPVLPGGGVLLVTVEGSYAPATLDPADRKPGVVHKQDGELLDTRPVAAWPAWFDAYRRIDAARGADIAADFTVAPAGSQPLVLVFPDGKAKDTSVFGLKPRSRDGSAAYVAGGTAVSSLMPGEKRRVYASTYDGSLAGFADATDGETGDVTLTLRSTATIAGRVLDANGQPLAGVGLRLAFDGSLIVQGGYMARRMTTAEDRRERLVNGYSERRGNEPIAATDERGTFRIERVVAGLPFDLTGELFAPPDAKGQRKSLRTVTLMRTTAKPGEALALGDLSSR